MSSMVGGRGLFVVVALVMKGVVRARRARRRSIF